MACVVQPRAAVMTPAASKRYSSQRAAGSRMVRAGENTLVPVNPAMYATVLSRTQRPARTPLVSLIHVPPGGSVRRAEPVTETGAARVTVRRDVTRQVEENVSPVCGPASRRTVRVAAAAGGAARVEAASAATSATRRRRSMRAGACTAHPRGFGF